MSTELLGNLPYIYVHQGGPVHDARLLPGKPEEIAQMEARDAEMRDRILSEVPHDETALNLERIGSFLGKYGLSLNPLIAIQEEDIGILDRLAGLGRPEGGVLVGGNFATLDLSYVVRRPGVEAVNGVEVTETIAVHELTHHSSKDTTVLYTWSDGRLEKILVRTGFNIDTHLNGQMDGHFYEEGLAGLMQSRYATEELQKPSGFSNWAGAHTEPMGGGKDLSIPRFYWVPKYPGELPNTPAASAFAAYGMELLIERDPLILDAMLESRSSSAGRSEFAGRIASLYPDLYRLLRAQHYTLSNFIASADYIVEKLYDGNHQKAAAVIIEKTEAAANSRG